MIKLKKIFELLGVEPYQGFKIKDGTGKTWKERYFLDENLDAWFINENGEKVHFSETLVLRFLRDIYKIIKLPKKKKLRDVTLEEWNKWRKHCRDRNCDKCIFKNVTCTEFLQRACWVNHKDLYSDKFLDQEIEVPE